jgi:hypothetical protein
MKPNHLVPWHGRVIYFKIGRIIHHLCELLNVSARSFGQLIQVHGAVRVDTLQVRGAGKYDAIE